MTFSLPTAPNDPRHVQQLIDHIANLTDEQVTAIRQELIRRADAADERAATSAQPVWTYSFPDACVGGHSKTITITRDEPLEHREIEDAVLRYGATSCQCTPPGVTS